MLNHQKLRIITRSAFFLAYVFAPVFDLFRFDLNSGKVIFFRQHWEIGIDSFRLAQLSAFDMLWNFASLVFLPVITLIVIAAVITWKWGLLYCGWLCPHESVVEIINKLMRRSSGKLTLWDRKTLPEKQLDGTRIKPNRYWWPLTISVILLIAFTWAIVLLTYLLPPAEIYGNLIHASFSAGQLIFLGVATMLFTIEFTLARHLFCRFGCSLGLFQSLIWMLNKKAMVVGFDRNRAKECGGCDQSCEIACPIKLKPRAVKRKMYSCSQCMRCIDACEAVHSHKNQPSLLQIVKGTRALGESSSGSGKKHDSPR